jgi:hypothetical protein
VNPTPGEYPLLMFGLYALMLAVPGACILVQWLRGRKRKVRL